METPGTVPVVCLGGLNMDDIMVFFRALEFSFGLALIMVAVVFLHAVITEDERKM